jgi:hypothetical protein
MTRNPAKKSLGYFLIGPPKQILEPEYERMCDSCVIRVTVGRFPSGLSDLERILPNIKHNVNPCS